MIERCSELKLKDLRTRQLTTKVFKAVRATDCLLCKFRLESFAYSNFVCNACGKDSHARIRLLSRSGPVLTDQGATLSFEIDGYIQQCVK